jgi:hypothetical protein
MRPSGDGGKKGQFGGAGRLVHAVGVTAPPAALIADRDEHTGKTRGILAFKGASAQGEIEQKWLMEIAVVSSCDT